MSKTKIGGESELQTSIEKYLKLLEQAGRVVYIKNNSGAYKTAAGGFVRFGRSGSPDFLLFLPQGRCLHLEVKSYRGKLSQSQQDYQKLMTEIGHRYVIVRSLSEVERLFSLDPDA